MFCYIVIEPGVTCMVRGVHVVEQCVKAQSDICGAGCACGDSMS